jgi:response regulator RpfG family c-di-GMP phosphodiesterase
MHEHITPAFVVIDDDPMNNFICRKVIQKLYANADIQTFTEPEAGLSYLISKYSTRGGTGALLFIDINMPTLSGWEVIEKFMDFPSLIKEQVTIYVFSSSIAVEDKKRAQGLVLVKGFLEKPLTLAQVEKCVLKYGG